MIGSMFTYLPKIPYTFQSNYSNASEAFEMLHLARRFDVRAKIESVVTVKDIYSYTIINGESPESLAAKIYNDPYLFWLILMVNRRLNPFTDWAKTDAAVAIFAENKYGVDKLNSIHHYENGDGVIIQPENYSGEDIVPVTNLQHEYNKNEQLKQIILIEPNRVPEILDMVRKAMEGDYV